MTLRSPVLFLVFNRPDTTAQVFQAIRAAKPPRLYVAADGPRPEKVGEAERCDAVRNVATSVDWPCQLVTLLRPRNLGCKRAVSSAIDWFFEHEPEGIILEDDCLPDPSFFPYCDELLERYRVDTRVMCISGDNFISHVWKPEFSYYFSKYVHVWGWASWRRAWARYDVAMVDWKVQAATDFMARQFPGAPRSQNYWRRVLNDVSAGRIDTWDYQWNYACWKCDGLGCIPSVNLVSNIGFGPGATHTVTPESKLAMLPRGSLDTPLRHPTVVFTETHADDWTSVNIFGINDGRRITPARIKKVLNRGLRRAWMRIAR